jgi:hypothetical protein
VVGVVILEHNVSGGSSNSSGRKFVTTQGISNLVSSPNKNLITQPGPSGFILGGFTPCGMAWIQGGSSVR